MDPITAMMIASAASQKQQQFTNTIGGLIQQGWSQAHQSAENEKYRNWSSGENELARDFTSSENLLNREFNSAEAQKARDFTERMSNSTYRRAVEDMKKAGINPALAGSLGGNNIGSSAVASYSSGANSGIIGAPSVGSSYANAFHNTLTPSLNAFSSAIQKTLNNNKHELASSYVKAVDDLTSNSAKSMKSEPVSKELVDELKNLMK